MKNTFQIVLMLALGVGLCIGCGKSRQPEAEPAEMMNTENWEPESVDLPEGHTADDGHDHGDHDHSGHSH